MQNQNDIDERVRWITEIVLCSSSCLSYIASLCIRAFSFFYRSHNSPQFAFFLSFSSSIVQFLYKALSTRFIKHHRHQFFLFNCLELNFWQDVSFGDVDRFRPTDYWTERNVKIETKYNFAPSIWLFYLFSCIFHQYTFSRQDICNFRVLLHEYWKYIS